MRNRIPDIFHRSDFRFDAEIDMGLKSYIVNRARLVRRLPRTGFCGARAEIGGILGKRGNVTVKCRPLVSIGYVTRKLTAYA